MRHLQNDSTRLLSQHRCRCKLGGIRLPPHHHSTRSRTARETFHEVESYHCSRVENRVAWRRARHIADGVGGSRRTPGSLHRVEGPHVHPALPGGVSERLPRIALRDHPGRGFDIARGCFSTQLMHSAAGFAPSDTRGAASRRTCGCTHPMVLVLHRLASAGGQTLPQRATQRRQSALSSSIQRAIHELASFAVGSAAGRSPMAPFRRRV